MVYDKTGDRDSLSWYQRILRWTISSLKRNTWDLGGWWFRWTTTRHGEIGMSTGEPDAGFLEHYRMQMNFSPTFSDSRILYLSLYTYLDGQMSSLTKQYQTGYNAIMNIRLAVIGSIPILVVNFGLGVLTGNSIQQLVALLFLVLIIILYPTIMIFGKASTNIERLYVESLMIEYLMTERSS